MAQSNRTLWNKWIYAQHKQEPFAMPVKKGGPITQRSPATYHPVFADDQHRGNDRPTTPPPPNYNPQALDAQHGGGYSQIDQAAIEERKSGNRKEKRKKYPFCKKFFRRQMKIGIMPKIMTMRTYQMKVIMLESLMLMKMPFPKDIQIIKGRVAEKSMKTGMPEEEKIAVARKVIKTDVFPEKGHLVIEVLGNPKTKNLKARHFRKFSLKLKMN